MSDSQSEAEGFFKPLIEIQHHQKKEIILPPPRPVDFQPRFINGHPMLKKQPSQCYQRFQEFETNKTKEFVVKNQAKREKRNILQNEYFRNLNYNLIYSRYGRNDNLTCDNFVKLPALNEHSPISYRLLKGFEETDFMHCNTLIIDSCFEGGNLMLAFQQKKNPHNYVLYTQNDTNSRGYNQWFYFSIENALKNVQYNFRIVNLRKKNSFFQEGMLPILFSLKDSKEKCGYSRCGFNVTYGDAKPSEQCELPEGFYELSFDIVFPNQNDFYTISQGLPYSYSRLIHHLSTIENSLLNRPEIAYQRTIVAHTLSNNQVPCLTVKNRNGREDKPIIVLMARQHPGETWSSFLMEQTLYNLCLQETCQAKWLLQNYQFVIFPMINVDGVIYGNFRCELGGTDINRNWLDTCNILYPQVHAIKSRLFSRKSSIACCLDFHGHSKSYNIFAYSCKPKDKSCFTFTYLLHQMHQPFDLSACTFGITPCKEKTARAVIFREIKNINVMTIECSSYGYIKDDKCVQFAPIHFKDYSDAIVKSCYHFFSESTLKKQVDLVIKQKIKEIFAKKSESFKNIEDSESDPEGDQIELEKKLQMILPKHTAKAILKPKQYTPQPKRIAKKIKPQKKNRLDSFVSQTLQPKKQEDLNPIKKSEKTIEKIQVNEAPTNRKQVERFKRTGRVSFQKRRDTNKFLKAEQQLSTNYLSPNSFRTTMLDSQKKKDYFQEVNLMQKKPKINRSRRPNQSQAKIKKNSSFKFVLDETGASKVDDLSLLCLDLSQHQEKPLKKQTRGHPKSLNGRLQTKEHSLTFLPSSLIQKKIETLRKLKEKQKNSDEMVSKIWRQNFARYNKKTAHVFIGGCD